MAKRDNDRMVPVKDAVAAAAGQLTALLPDVEGVLLEEAEITGDDRYWLVTLSCFQVQPTPTSPTGIFAGIFPLKQRVYKVFKIDRRTGEVRSMKMRELQDA